MQPQTVGPEHRRQIERYQAARRRMFNPPRKIDAESVSNAFLEMVAEECEAVVKVSFKQILCAVEKRLKCSRSNILSPRRFKELAYARQITMYLARTHTGLSTPRIGQKLNRDHSTVIHGYRKIEEQLLAGDPKLRRDLDAIRGLL